MSNRKEQLRSLTLNLSLKTHYSRLPLYLTITLKKGPFFDQMIDFSYSFYSELVVSNSK